MWRNLGLTAALAGLFAVGCAANSANSSGPPPQGFGGSTSTGGGAAVGSGGSSSSGTGGSSGRCLTDTCVDPLSTSVAWAVEIDPASSSAYTHTQIPTRDVSKSASFVAVERVPISVTFSGPASGGGVPTNANVLLSVPASIPGRPDLVYQAAAIAGTATTTAAISVPQDALNASGSLSLIPLPPSDQQAPIYPFNVRVLTTMALTLPDGDVLFSGQVVDSLQNPPAATFVARAFDNGAQVSNAPLTQADGTFQLRVPAARTANPLTIELLPMSADPLVLSAAITVSPGKKLGTISLPAYTPATGFNVAVTNGTTGISGVSVRAQTSLGDLPSSGPLSGTAQYAATGSTGSTGNVALQLLPGSTYAIAATPAGGSAYATRCISMVKTVSGGPSNGSGPPTLQTIVATFRPVLTGVVKTADGTPIPNLTVAASGTPDALPPCSAPTATSASTSTDGTGTFRLPLDPGTYQLDYDPPAGSAAPRMTEWAVTISGADTVQHDITLPAGALVAGSVTGSRDEALSSAVVRFFEVRCTGASDCQGANRIPPRLIGKALTDAQGRFRMVVPVPAAP